MKVFVRRVRVSIDAFAAFSAFTDSERSVVLNYILNHCISCVSFPSVFYKIDKRRRKQTRSFI